VGSRVSISTNLATSLAGDKRRDILPPSMDYFRNHKAVSLYKQLYSFVPKVFVAATYLS
jgi:hypothetical protein